MGDGVGRLETEAPLAVSAAPAEEAAPPEEQLPDSIGGFVAAYEVIRKGLLEVDLDIDRYDALEARRKLLQKELIVLCALEISDKGTDPEAIIGQVREVFLHMGLELLILKAIAEKTRKELAKAAAHEAKGSSD